MRSIVLVSFLLAFAHLADAQERTWHDQTGKFSVEAELLKVDGETVKLKKADGSVISVPIDRLSDADKQYLKGLSKEMSSREESASDRKEPEFKPFDLPAATGKIHGEPFKPDRFELQSTTLEIREGKDFLPDRSLTLFLFLDEGESVEGKKFNVRPKPKFGASTPHVHMNWKGSDGGGSGSDVFMDGYTMSLEFGKSAGGKIPGKINLKLPDQEKSFVKGSFVIVEPGATTEPGTTEILGAIAVPGNSDDLDVSIKCLGKNGEGKLEGPGVSFSLASPTAAATSLTWKPRNTSMKWDKGKHELIHKHINRPPGPYLVILRGDRQEKEGGRLLYTGIYDWKWVKLADDLQPQVVDLAIDPSRLGTLEITLADGVQAEKVTYLPLDEDRQLPIPDAHRYSQNTSAVEIVAGKATIKNLREGWYQLAIPPWRPEPITVNVEVTAGQTTRITIPK